MDKPWIVVPSNSKLKFSFPTLEKDFNVIYDRELESTSPELLEKVEGVFFSRSSPPVDLFLKLLPSVKVFALASVGTDNIDAKHLMSLGIQTGYTGGVNSLSVAEFAISLLFAVAKNICPTVKRLKEGENLPPLFSDEVTGSTVGIVGMGNIGYQVARKLTGFDVKILYKNRRKRSEEDEKAVNAKFCENLSHLLSQSDFVIITTPKNSETYKMFGAEQFCQMKKSAYVINVARGDIIDQDALVDALQKDEIRGAALDVSSPEPLPKKHPLLNMPNVIVTPHVAWATQKTKERMIDVIKANLVAGIKGEPLPSPVPL